MSSNMRVDWKTVSSKDFQNFFGRNIAAIIDLTGKNEFKAGNMDISPWYFTCILCPGIWKFNITFEEGNKILCSLWKIKISRHNIYFNGDAIQKFSGDWVITRDTG